MSSKTYTVVPGDMRSGSEFRVARDVVKTVLNERSGWRSKGYRFSEAASYASPDFTITFWTDDHIVARFGRDFRGLSVCENQRHIYINLQNWRSGANAGFADVRQYRRYVVNHEVGHVLGYGHVDARHHCRNGGRASVMSQQTKGQFGCTPYSHVQGSTLPSLNINGGKAAHSCILL